MELKELQDKLNRKHVKVKMPKIRAEAYAAAYAKMLKDFTDDVVENFSSLVIAIYELTEEGVKKAVLDSSLPALQAFRMTRERVMDEGSFDEWDEFFKEHEQDITNIERELYGRKKRKSRRPFTILACF